MIRAGCRYLPKEYLPEISSTTWKYSHKSALASPEEKGRNPLLQGILAAPFPSKPFPSFDSESGRVENAFQEFQHVLEVLERRNSSNNWIFHKFQFGFVWEDNPRILGICQDLNGFIQTSCGKSFQCWCLAPQPQSTIFREQFHPGMTHWKQLEVVDLFGSGKIRWDLKLLLWERSRNKAVLCSRISFSCQILGIKNHGIQAWNKFLLGVGAGREN